MLWVRRRDGVRGLARCKAKIYKNYETKELIASVYFESGFHTLYKYKDLNHLMKDFEVFDDGKW